MSFRRRALANLIGKEEQAKLPAVTRRLDTGPCPWCGSSGGHLIADHARDSLSHSEPVCAPFERHMTALMGNRGQPSIMHTGLGVLVPDLERLRAEHNRH